MNQKEVPPAEAVEQEQDIETALALGKQFLAEQTPQIGPVFGINNLDVEIGDGWSTELNTERPRVTADIRFFLERDYTPKQSVYALVHEVAAHLREVVFAPELTYQVKRFIKDDKAKSIFHNIFSDIAGNNLIHATLPDMEEVGKDLYETKLFKETDYSQEEPRHLQFLYKVIRQEMIPGSDTAVLPEVDAMIDELRNFQGIGDLIKYSTQVAKSAKVAMPAEERFTIWKDVIYPRWQELIELDKQDPIVQRGEGQGDGQPESGEPDFSKRYDDYFNKRHPEPMSEEEHEAIHKAVEQKRRQDKSQERQAEKEASPEYQLDKKLREETGHSLADQRKYQAEVLKWASQIEDMRQLFRSVIHERIAQKRALRGDYSEGALLNPDRLAQTYIDVQSGASEPAAFHAYESVTSERELVGKTDYIFVFDRSGSMGGKGKSEAAASSLVICLEGLNGMQQDIKEAEREAGVTIDLDIRTALYTFNDEISNPKPLGHGLTPKQRLDAYGEVVQPGGGNADSIILADLESLAAEPDRRKILIMVADGGADNPTLAKASVKRLRDNGWRVYGISIGSDAAVKLYAPDSQRVDNPAILPDVMKTFIESTF